MLAIIIVGIVIYCIIESKFEIDPYEDVSSKRVKRISKGLIYFLISVVFFFFREKNMNLSIPWIVTAVLWVGNWLSAINHYLNLFCICGCVYGGIGYALWYYLYDEHKVAVTIVLVILIMSMVFMLIDTLNKMKHGCDRDIDEAKEEEERKQKRFNKMIFKVLLKMLK